MSTLIPEQMEAAKRLYVAIGEITRARDAYSQASKSMEAAIAQAQKAGLSLGEIAILSEMLEKAMQKNGAK